MSDSTRITPILAVVSGAGSAGKTTTATTLATMLAEQGQRVLLVDLDPQANATSALGVDPAGVRNTIGSVMLREVALSEAVVDTHVDGVQLVPSSDLLSRHALELETIRMSEPRLARALRDVDADVVILDCQAGDALLPVAALVAATSVITTTFPSTKELQGISRIEALVGEVADEYERDLRLGAVVPCSVPPPSSGRLYVDAMTALRETYPELVTPPVRRSVAAARAYDQSSPLPISAPREPVTEDYRAVYADLRAKGVL